MREPTTWIKVDRNIMDWRWFKDSKTLHVFLWLLLNANIEERDFKSAKIGRGQVATSYSNMAKDTNLTYAEVRGAIQRLVRTGECTIKRFTNFLVITIVSYDRYQTSNNHLTITQQSLNNHSTINQQQLKNIRSKEGENNARTRATRPKSYMEEMDEIIDRVWDEMEGKQ